MNVKKLEDEIRQLTILYSTAREEGDEEEHERVVKEIISLFSDIIREIVGEDVPPRFAERHRVGKWKLYRERRELINGVKRQIRQRAKKLGIKI